jgi:hypothetical protein
VAPPPPAEEPATVVPVESPGVMPPPDELDPVGDEDAAPGVTPAKAVVALDGAFEGARAMISSCATTRAASGA